MPTGRYSDEDRLSLRRRQLLTTSGIGIAAVAGCGGTDNDDSKADSEETTGGDNADSDDDGGDDEEDEEQVTDSPPYSVSITPAVTAEVGVWSNYTFSLENQADESLELRYGVDVRWPDAFDKETLWTNEGTLSAGQSFTDEIEFYTGGTGTVEWEAWAESSEYDPVFDEAETRAEIAERDWREPFTPANNLTITMSEPTLTSSYEYEDFGGSTETETAPAGEQFVFIDVHIRNESDERRQSPNRLSFELATGDEQTETMSRSEYQRDDGYEGLNDILDGVEEDGILPYTISSNADLADLRLFHSEVDHDFGVAWEVIWS